MMDYCALLEQWLSNIYALACDYRSLRLHSRCAQATQQVRSGYAAGALRLRAAGALRLRGRCAQTRLARSRVQRRAADTVVATCPLCLASGLIKTTFP